MCLIYLGSLSKIETGILYINHPKIRLLYPLKGAFFIFGKSIDRLGYFFNMSHIWIWSSSDFPVFPVV